MRRAAVLAWLAVAALASAAGAAVRADAAFASPAQAQGDVAVAGAGWVLLVFHGDGADVRLGLDGPVQARNDTLLKATSAASNVQSPDLRSGPLPQTLGAVSGGLAFGGHDWSSLYVEADDVAVQATGVQGTLRRADGDLDAAHLAGRPEQPRLSTSPFEPPQPVGAAVGLRPQEGAAAFQVSVVASHVRRVTWHNATVACGGPDGCPDAGSPWSSPPNAAGLEVLRLSYITLEAPGGSLDGSGQAWAMAAGGSRIDVAIDGSVRMQDARVAGDCGEGACADPAGRTLRGDGHLLLAGLGADPGDPRLLQAGLQGDFDHAAFDEAPAPGYAAQAAVATAAAALGLVVLAKLLLALFARSSRPPALEQPRRKEVYDLIRASPGLSYRELQRRTGWPNGPLQGHLRRLEDAGLVVARRLRNTVRWFENHGRYDGTWREVAQLTDGRSRRLHEWLAANPGAGQGAVVAQAAAWGWSRSAAQRVLRNLTQAGLVAQARRGRAVAYTAIATALPGSGSPLPSMAGLAG